MTDKLEDTSLRLKDEMDLYRKMMDKLWQNRHEFQKEREAMQEVRRCSLFNAQLLNSCPQLISIVQTAIKMLQGNRATFTES